MTDEVQEPDWSSTYDDELDVSIARQTWMDATTELREREALSPASAAMVERLAWFRVQFARNQRAVTEKGAVTRARRTGTQQWNLNWKAALQAEEAARALERELGISPTRRGAIKPAAQRKRRGPVAADEFLHVVKGGRK